MPAEAELRPWLYRIATNLAVDHLRRRRRFAFLLFSARERDLPATQDPTTGRVSYVARPYFVLLGNTIVTFSFLSSG